MRHLARLSAPLLLLATACASARPADPNLVQLDARLGQTVLAAGETQRTAVVLRVAAQSPQEEVHAPLHVAILIDASGSMEGEAIARAREAAVTLLDRLHPNDRLTVVAFSTDVEVLSDGETLADSDLPALRKRLAELPATGTTNLGGALHAALAILERVPPRDEVRRLVLLSDGHPNLPAQVDAELARLVQLQVPVTALGLGLDFDELLLARMAEQTGGHFTFVEAPAMLAALFDEAVLRLDRVVARSAVVAVTPGPGVRIVRVEGQAPSTQGGPVSITLGDLAAREVREIVVTIELESRRPDARLEVVDAVLGFEDAVGRAGQLERRKYLSATTSLDPVVVGASQDAQSQGAAVRARAGSAALDAIALARAGQHEAAEKLIDTAILVARADGADAEDPRLAAAIRNLERLRENLPAPGSAPELTAAQSSAARRAHSDAWSYSNLVERR